MADDVWAFRRCLFRARNGMTTLAPHSGPSFSDSCRRTIRPTATSTAAIRNVRFTSTLAGRNAQKAVIPEVKNVGPAVATGKVDPSGR
jgi:hypothetical protein